METNKTYNYKIVIEKMHELLSDKNNSAEKQLNSFEKHMIQEGIKDILLGMGPRIVENTLGKEVQDITPSMRNLLIEYGVIKLEVS